MVPPHSSEKYESYILGSFRLGRQLCMLECKQERYTHYGYLCTEISQKYKPMVSIFYTKIAIFFRLYIVQQSYERMSVQSVKSEVQVGVCVLKFNETTI